MNMSIDNALYGIDTYVSLRFHYTPLGNI